MQPWIQPQLDSKNGLSPTASGFSDERWMEDFIRSIKKSQIWHRKLNFCSLFDLKTVQTKWRTQKGYLLVLFVIIMCFNESLYDLGHGKKVFLQSKISRLSIHWSADAQIWPWMLARLYSSPSLVKTKHVLWYNCTIWTVERVLRAQSTVLKSHFPLSHNTLEHFYVPITMSSEHFIDKSL